MEQDEIPECRICRCEGDEERPLFYPCACTGSIKWCHESCLVEWIKVSRSREYCETCGTQLMFKPVYSEATPAVLSPGELLWLGLKRIAKEVPYAVRATIVTMLWLGFVPLFSATAFNYLRPPDEYNNDEPSSTWIEWLLTRPNPISLFMWETGIWILLAGFFWLFTLVSVFDFVRGFEMGEYATELEAFQQRARARREGDIVEQLPNQGNLGNEALRPLADIAENNDADEFEGGDEDDVDADIPVAEPFVEEIQPGMVNNNEQNNDGEAARNDNLDDLGGDQLGFDEWIGLRGPWCLTMNNVLCLCFCVLLFLVTFYVVPESLGRGVLREASRVTIPMVKSGLDSLNSTTIIPPEVLVFAKHLVPDNTSGLFHSKQIERWSQDEICKYHEPWGTVGSVPPKMCEVDLIEKSLKQIEMYEFETMSVIVGLIVTMSFIQIQFAACRWGWHMFAKARFRPSYPLRGCPYHVWRSVLRSTRTIVRVQKVVCLLVFKMIGFPIVLGALINAALKPALGIPENDRTLFMAEHPHLTVLMLWVAGITHTLLVTMNVILVRDILHSEVLDGIIRMRDPHGNQFLPLLVEPIIQQTKRTFVTCGIYTVIVVLFVSLPCYAAQKFQLLPLPVSMRFASVGLQLPIESTFFHMWMLHILERSKPNMVMAQTWFFQNTCHVLGLTEYLLPVPIDEQEYTAAVRRAQVQAGQLHWLDSSPRVSANLLKPRVKPRWALLRLMAFGLIAWTFWFASVVICVSLPYLVGIAAISCFPALPIWVKTDVRLYFVGFVILRYVYMYFPRVELYYLRIAMYATRNFKDLAALSCGALFLGIICPSIAGAFVFLETAFSDSDFPAERYLEVSYPKSISIFVAFLQDFIAKLPFVRVWFAGFPIVLLISSKTTIGRSFWRAVLHLRPSSAGQHASKLLLIGLGSMLVGIFLGLEFWHRAGITSSPLSTVRTSVLSSVVACCLPTYLSKYYGVVRAACRRFHDTLKDEKYLMGRRLRNYDARVV